MCVRVKKTFSGEVKKGAKIVGGDEGGKGGEGERSRFKSPENLILAVFHSFQIISRIKLNVMNGSKCAGVRVASFPLTNNNNNTKRFHMG